MRPRPAQARFGVVVECAALVVLLSRLLAAAVASASVASASGCSRSRLRWAAGVRRSIGIRRTTGVHSWPSVLFFTPPFLSAVHRRRSVPCRLLVVLDLGVNDSAGDKSGRVITPTVTATIERLKFRESLTAGPSGSLPAVALSNSAERMRRRGHTRCSPCGGQRPEPKSLHRTRQRPYIARNADAAWS
jgi:hypothetical protein